MQPSPEDMLTDWLTVANDKLEEGKSFEAYEVLGSVLDLAEEYECSWPKRLYDLQEQIFQTELLRKFRDLVDCYDGNNPRLQLPHSDLSIIICYGGLLDFMREAVWFIGIPESLHDLVLEYDTGADGNRINAEITTDPIKMALYLVNAGLELSRQPWYAKADERLSRANH